MWTWTSPAGRVTVLMGAGGCGKSTLAAVAAGLYPENGGFLAGGADPLGRHGPGPPWTPSSAARQVGMLFQNPDLQFCMDTLRGEMRFCMENLCLDARCDGPAHRGGRRRTGVQALLDRPLHTLSGGEKQRAALACLYVMECRCLLLDECFANLDRDAARELMEMLRRMHRQGRTIIAIDHQPALWLDTADEFILLREGGRVAARGLHRGNLPQQPRAVCGAGPVLPPTRRRPMRPRRKRGRPSCVSRASASRRAKRSRSGGLFSAAPPRPRRFCWTARRRSSPKGR